MKNLFFFSVLIVLIWVDLFAQDNYELLYLQNDLDQIEQFAQKKTSADDFYWYALVLEKKGNLSLSISILEEGLTLFQGNEKLEVFISNLYFESGHYLKAENYLRKYKHYPQTFMQLVQVNEFRNNYNTAIKLLKERLTIDSANTQLLTHLGDNYYQMDSFNLALDYYRKAFQQDSSDQVTAGRLANIYLKREEFDQSIELCELILTKDSTNKKFIKLLGISYFNKKAFSKAGSCFFQLYHAGDSNRFVLKHLGICELNNYSFTDARRYLLSAYKKDSNDIETCFCLGKAFSNSMWPEKGLYYLARADSLSQPNPKVLSAIHLEKQAIYSVLKRNKDALTEYQLVYQYNPKPEYLFYMASLYQNKLGEKQKALEHYEAFIDQLPLLQEPVNNIKKDEVTIILRKVAEENIVALKEELFFEGD